MLDRVFLEAHRRAKFILLPPGDLLLAVHFALWGTLALVPPDQPRLPETLIILAPRPGPGPAFDRQSWICLRGSGSAECSGKRFDLKALGPEALDPGFSVDVLTRQLSRRRGVLKSVLLNQRILAGLGNRDADESMWLAESIHAVPLLR